MLKSKLLRGQMHNQVPVMNDSVYPINFGLNILREVRISHSWTPNVMNFYKFIVFKFKFYASDHW